MLGRSRKSIDSRLKLLSPPNPRHMLQAGKPDGRNGSPTLGDFKLLFPQNWGLGGETILLLTEAFTATCGRFGNTILQLG